MSLDTGMFLFSFVSFVLVILFLQSYFPSSKSNKKLPPSPPRLPLIGNLHQLRSSSHRVLRSMAQTYGPIMLLHFGTVPVIVASTVDAAKEIMKTNDVIFSNRPYSNIASRLFYGSKDVVFSEYGEYWRQMKSILVLRLLNNKRVQSYQKVREDEVARIIKQIQGANESVVNLSELLLSYTNNIVCRVGLGRTYEGVDDNYKNLLNYMDRLLARFSFGTYIPWLAWVDKLSGLHQEADEVAKKVDAFYEGVINAHVNKKEVGVEVQDFVDILLEIQKEQSSSFRLERYMIKAILMDVFGAGTGTTFTTLEWTVSELIQNPRVMKELKKEAHSIGKGRALIPEEDIEKMPYLQAVLKESLRLHIPAPLLVPHESTKDVNLFGYDIPSGTQVMVNAWAIARDPSIWEEPEEFRPERFLNTSVNYKGLHYEFIPFGAGRRICPGISFATCIAELVLANLVYKFNFAVPGEHGLDMTEIEGLSIHKKTPILVKATPC